MLDASPASASASPTACSEFSLAAASPPVTPGVLAACFCCISFRNLSIAVLTSVPFARAIASGYMTAVTSSAPARRASSVSIVPRASASASSLSTTMLPDRYSHPRPPVFPSTSVAGPRVVIFFPRASMIFCASAGPRAGTAITAPLLPLPSSATNAAALGLAKSMLTATSGGSPACDSIMSRRPAASIGSGIA